MKFRRMKNNSNFSIRNCLTALATIFVCSCTFSYAVTAEAGNFVQSPNRDDSSGFPGFFLKRFIHWTFQSILMTSKILPPDQKAYMVAFAATTEKFGKKTGDGFVRSVDLSLPSTNASPWFLEGTLRLLDLEDRPPLRELALKLIRQHAPNFDVTPLNGHSIGLGFSSRYHDIEIIIKEDDLLNSVFFKDLSPKAQALVRERPRGVLVLSLEKGKVASIEITQIGIRAPTFCPPATHSLQTDRVVNASGDVTYIWHVDQFEPLALAPVGRRIYEDAWKDLNINPGTVKWSSPNAFALSYP